MTIRSVLSYASMGRSMSQEWTRTYWGIVDEFYWTPKYLGLDSISRRSWVDDGEFVSIPKEMTNTSGPLYRRTRFGSEYWDYIRRQEETFNHMLDLVFAILPGDVISELFEAISGQTSRHEFVSIGAEIRSRYHWKEQSNITTPDGFFIADQAISALEIKFDSPTSLDQLAKYVLLMVCEEQLTGRRRELALTYIFNGPAEAMFERHIGIPSKQVDGALFDQMASGIRSKTVSSFILENAEAGRAVLDRLRIQCIDWSEFSHILVAHIEKLGPSAGDRTLGKLLNGLVYEIAQHPLSNVTPSVEPGGKS